MKSREVFEKANPNGCERRRRVAISRILRSRGNRLERRMRDSVGAVLNAQVMMRQIERWNERIFLIPAFVL